MSYRAAVIGAGHHGLVAAIKLAAAGCEVVVLEAASEPGGAVRTEQLTLPRFHHDSCSGFFPLTAASPVFRELELGLDWINPPIPMVHVLADSGEDIALHRDIEATASSLDARAPGAGRGWRELMRALLPHRQDLIRLGLARLPALRPLARTMLSLRSSVLELAPLALASSASLGRRLFDDDGAAAWLASSGAHADLSPLAAGSGAFSLGLQFLGHVVGWPFPHGGAGTLSDALVRRLAAHGGEVRCGAEVAALELRSGRVSAVRLLDGGRIAVDGVVATVSPAPLLTLLPPGALPGTVQQALSHWRYGLGTLKLDYALSGPVPWRSLAAREAGVVQVGGLLQEVVASLEEALCGLMPERPTLVVGQQSLHDAARAPAGQQTLYVYARVPCGQLDETHAVGLVERQLERFAPGFGGLVRARSVRPPARIEAENRSMCGGDLASGSCALDQQLVFRPAPQLCRGRTPVQGLFVAGAWVHPGPGVHGVSGHGAGVALARELRRRSLASQMRRRGLRSRE
jgi:phytoene dehydrogenase-like protein